MRKLRGWYRIVRMKLWIWRHLLWEAILRFLWKRIVRPAYWRYVKYLERLAHEGMINPRTFFDMNDIAPPKTDDRYDGANRHAR
jgi:hypothetical protein